MAQNEQNSYEYHSESSKSQDMVYDELKNVVPEQFQQSKSIEVVETVEANSAEYVDECIKLESNSIRDSRESWGYDDEDTIEEVPLNKYCSNKSEETDNTKNQNSWPTLEILPGGLIRPADDVTSSLFVEVPVTETQAPNRTEELMYACAKCPMRFCHLYLLTKHIKTHQQEKRKAEGLDLRNLSTFEKELVSLRRERLQMEAEHKLMKLDVMSRIATALSNIDPQEFIS